jgi:hypothetical protein
MPTSTPEFTDQGLLPSGVHLCSGSDFIERFCTGEKRQDFSKAIVDILNFAAARNVRYVFVGGSFVTNKEAPRDLDVVMVLRRREDIPTKNERLLIAGRKTDIMFCSEDEPKILDAFVHLLANGRYAEQLGVVQIAVRDADKPWQIRHPPDDDTYEVIKRAYFNRELIDLSIPTGILVTVHGLLSTGSWNEHIVPIASSQGWIVAPYYYGFQTPEILFSPSKRKAAVEGFREWIFDVSQTYGASGVRVSAIAHSFGTYLIGAYLAGFQEVPPVTFNSLILTGSILSEKYDWNACAGMKVARVRNEIAPNDQWVKWMPQTPPEWLGLDPLFGLAGTKGFSCNSEILEQPSNTIFDHNNVIKRDVVTSQWMPYLTSNRNAGDEEFMKYVKKLYSKNG